MLNKLKIKYIQSLSQKKLRDEKGFFVAEGPKIVEEILRAPNVQALGNICYQLVDSSEPSLEAALSGEYCRNHGRRTRSDFVITNSEPGAGIIQAACFWTCLKLDNKVSLMLDGIQDPGNLGTIIRCADWFGVQKYHLQYRLCQMYSIPRSFNLPWEASAVFRCFTRI